MKKNVMKLLVSISFLMLLSGCAVAPSWVQSESDTFYSARIPALYTVGEADSELPDRNIKSLVARSDATRSLSGVRKDYVKKVLLSFAAENDHWFVLDALEDEIDDIVEVASEQISLSPEYVQEWEDTRFLPWEDRAGRGRYYVLSKFRLDADFHANLFDSLMDGLRAGSDRLLQADEETVSAGLAEYLGV